MELSVDRERCYGAGMCVLTAPEVFEQDAEDGRTRLLSPRPPHEHRAAAREAAWLCPVAAITVTEQDGPKPPTP
ncbi:ferredoxin [Streptomyces rimosus]|uniref:ferredoxin n=1 Tax=Streptomyces rimosus TaxID=1927 RepID=UPI0004CAB13B|nr:ferredoxin [Streptomyces rimosus]